MPRWINVAVQLVAMAAQFLLIPEIIADAVALKVAHAVVAFLQAALAIVGHSFNPDGTPAKVAYQPPPGGGPPYPGGGGLVALALALLIGLPSAQATVRVLAVPQPMEVVAARIGAARPPMGLWYLHLQNTGDQAATVTREQIVIALSEWCQRNRRGQPLFLDKSVAGPVLLKARGGKWLRFLQWAATYGGSGAAIAGIPWAATAVPISDFVGRAAGAAVPDVSTLQLELPATVQIAPGAGATLQAWSGRMRKPPDVIGPIEL